MTTTQTLLPLPSRPGVGPLTGNVAVAIDAYRAGLQEWPIFASVLTDAEVPVFFAALCNVAGTAGAYAAVAELRAALAALD